MEISEKPTWAYEQDARFSLVYMLIKLNAVSGGVYIDTPIGPVNEKYFGGYPNSVPGTHQLSVRLDRVP